MKRIDDLQYENLKIIQDTEGFRFGVDSVLLTEFARDIKQDSTIVDLGTGNGILSILLCKKVKPKKIIGIEKQEKVFELCKENIKLNNLENQFEVINADVKDLICNKEKKDEMHKSLNTCNKDISKDNITPELRIKKNKKIVQNQEENKSNYEKLDYKIIFEQVDTIVTNPPYKKLGTGVNAKNEIQQISRFESTATLDDWIKTSNKILKSKGSFYMVYRTDRLTELFAILKKYKMEIKRIRFVYSNIKAESNLVLIKAIKNARPYLKVEKPLIIYNEDGTYTEEILNNYKND